MTAFTATFAASGSSYTFTISPANTVAVPDDTVTIQLDTACSSPTLSWSPATAGLFGPSFTSGSSVSNGTQLTISQVGPETMFTLTLNTADTGVHASATLFVRPTAYTATFVASGSSSSLSLSLAGILRPDDQLTLSGVPDGGNTTLSWSPATAGLFGSNVTSGSTVSNGQVLTVGQVSGMFTLTLADGTNGSASTTVYVNAIEIHYNGTETLVIIPSDYVNHGDLAQVTGLPGITSGTLSWTDSNLFAQTSPFDLTQSQTLTISASAMQAQDTLSLVFVPADGSGKVVATGSLGADNKTGTGQLDPTGDDKTVKGQGARRRARVATHA